MSEESGKFEEGWPPNGRWKSPSLEGAERAAYLAKNDLLTTAGRGRPGVVHPVFEAVRKSLRKRAIELGPRGYDRFFPYRIEFAMLFLASFSPSVVQRLLNEIFTAETTKRGSTIQWGPTPPSIPTIRRAYSKVHDELISTDLVSRIPKSWHQMLRKYRMGAWHKEAPDWMLEAYYGAGISAPLPLRVTKPKLKKRKSGMHRNEVDPDPLVEDADVIAGVISNQIRQTAASLSPSEKTKRLKRELDAIRKVFPDFSLGESEKLIAWDLGLTAVREERESRKSGACDLAIIAQKDIKPNEKVGRSRIDPERRSPKSGSPKRIESSHHEDVATNQELEVTSSEAPSAETSIEYSRVQVLPSESEVEDGPLQPLPVLGDSGDEKSWILREHRVDVLRSNHWDLADCPRIIFPDVLEDTPEDTYQAWLDFDPDHDMWDIPVESEYNYALEYEESDSGLIDLVEHGYLAEAIYGDTFPAMHRSILFCWILEKIVARTLKLKYGQIDYQTDRKYMPMAYVWSEADAAHWIENWNPQFWAPLTPLRLEMLRPRSVSEILDGYEWIPGWGFMHSDVVEHAMLIFAKPQSSSMKGEKLRESEWTWAAAVYRARGATRVAEGASFVQRVPLPGGKARFSMPFCVDYSSIRFPESVWMDFLGTPGMWVSRGHGEASVVAQLIQVESHIHIPSVMMIERYLVGRAEGFIAKTNL